MFSYNFIFLFKHTSVIKIIKYLTAPERLPLGLEEKQEGRSACLGFSIWKHCLDIQKDAAPAFGKKISKSPEI